jgi:hypothetical protein
MNDRLGFNPNMILDLIVKAIFPEKQRNEMLKIISTSSMAMDFFLNLRSVDRTYLFVRILKFYLGSLFTDSEKVSLVDQLNEEQKEFEKIQCPLF